MSLGSSRTGTPRLLKDWSATIIPCAGWGSSSLIPEVMKRTFGNSRPDTVSFWSFTDGALHPVIISMMIRSIACIPEVRNNPLFDDLDRDFIAWLHIKKYGPVFVLVCSVAFRTFYPEDAGIRPVFDRQRMVIHRPVKRMGDHQEDPVFETFCSDGCR